MALPSHRASKARNDESEGTDADMQPLSPQRIHPGMAHQADAPVASKGALIEDEHSTPPSPSRSVTPQDEEVADGDEEVMPIIQQGTDNLPQASFPPDIPHSVPREASRPPTPEVEDWDAAQEMDPAAEEGEFARFVSQVKGRNIDDVRREIDEEITSLNEQRRNAMRDSDDITQQMINQIMVRIMQIKTAKQSLN